MTDVFSSCPAVSHTRTNSPACSTQVAKFHRKVVRRLATEKRAADAHARGERAVKVQIGSADSFANFGDRLEPRGRASGGAQGTPWEHAFPLDEVMCMTSSPSWLSSYCCDLWCPNRSTARFASTSAARPAATTTNDTAAVATLS